MCISVEEIQFTNVIYSNMALECQKFIGNGLGQWFLDSRAAWQMCRFSGPTLAPPAHYGREWSPGMCF